MKIFAVGMNYQEHNKELHGTLLNMEEPVIFTKADSALLKDGKPFFIPAFTNQCEYETEVVVRICRLGRSIAQRWAHRYYDQVTVGIDFTARDLQRRLREKGLPWELCKGFDGSAVIGEMQPTDALPDVQDLHFRLDINGQAVQQGHTADMLFRVDEIVSYVSRFFTLKMGDLIFTGTPAGVGPVHEGDHLEGYLEGKKVLAFNVR
ncbi:MAG: fumarylacetoacetate hydrolase family protein [Bacteroidaceae bacterium]|nr:fumarylacetoacetate hydrolase family protein [Bacteroidaceae bacterium]